MIDKSENLPREAVDRFKKPFARFLKIEAASAGLLLLAVLAEMVLANSPWVDTYLAFWEFHVSLTFGVVCPHRVVHLEC